MLFDFLTKMLVTTSLKPERTDLTGGKGEWLSPSQTALKPGL